MRPVLISVWLVFFLAGICTPAKTAAEIVLAISPELGFYSDFASQLHQTLNENAIKNKVVRVTPKGLIPSLNDAPKGTIITVGPSAFTHFLSNYVNQPIIATLITSKDFQKILTEAGMEYNPILQTAPKRNITAIFHDPPIYRQVLLAKALLPRAQRMGLIVDKPDDINALTLSLFADDLGVQPIISLAEEPSSIPEALHQIVHNADVLIAIDNSHLFNGSTIKTLLLTLYRHNKVMIGLSPGFVKAGSLATSYTTQKDLLEEVVALIQIYANNSELPKPHFADRYQLFINEAVAYSLNIPIPDKRKLKERLKQLEAQFGAEYAK